MSQIKKPIITLSIATVLLACIPLMALWLDKYFTHIGIGIIALSFTLQSATLQWVSQHRCRKLKKANQKHIGR